MKILPLAVTLAALLCLVLLPGALAAGAGAPPGGSEAAKTAAESGKKAAGGQYVCPMCYPVQDKQIYDRPGKCPICGMALVEKSAARSVAILIFDGVQIIDYTGPYEVLGQAHFNVFTVSEKGTKITTSMGMSVNPAFSFATSPEPDILVLPGGEVDAVTANPRIVDWVRRKSATAQHVMSVCNGAFILAKAGLLDGLSATTFYGLIGELRASAPKVKVVTDQRFVDNGKIITSAGLSSGIDAALHLVEKIKGRGKAEALALHLEYDWRPDSGFARAALADRRLPDVDFPDGVRLEPLETRGDRERWDASYEVAGAMSASEALDHVEAQLAKLPAWKRVRKEGSAATRRTTWSFTDDQGGTWICETFLGAPVAGGSGPTLAFALRRAGPSPGASAAATKSAGS
jgi:putative intracellular protease/amidase